MLTDNYTEEKKSFKNSRLKPMMLEKHNLKAF